VGLLPGQEHQAARLRDAEGEGGAGASRPEGKLSKDAQEKADKMLARYTKNVDRYEVEKNEIKDKAESLSKERRRPRPGRATSATR